MAQQPQGFVPDGFVPDQESDDKGRPVYRSSVTEPNTLGTFASHVGAQINPMTMAQSAGNAILHPIDTVQQIGAAQGAVYDKAKASYDKGDYGTAARHFVDYLIPLIGPVLDTAADRTQKGELAAGVGDAVGLGLSMFGPSKLGAVAGAVRESAPVQKIAAMADAGAAERTAQTIRPTVGANKVRFGRMADDVAPSVARETTGLTRSAMADSISGKLEEATAQLDQAADNRLAAKSYPTQPVLDSLQAARKKLTAEAVQGSRFTPQSGVNRPPIGNDVVPGPNAARVAQIDKAIAEVKELGPVAKYESIRRIREAWDGPARAKYSPAVTTDFLAKQGEAMGAADVTGSLRAYLAKLDPATAEANAGYSLWKKANDVIQAAEETDKARPTVGRTLMARGLGAAAGAAEGGGGGAIVGAIIGPLVERVAMNTAPAMRMVVARQLANLADALRTGQSTRAAAAIQTLRGLVPATAGKTSGAAVAVPMTADQAGAQ